MSAENNNVKKTIPYILEMKNRNKISALTAYDYITAKIQDQVGIDIILVGDSVAMVVGGENDTLKLDMEEMVYHTRIVAKGVKNALLVADMPFMSYQVSVERGVENAGKLIKAGAEAVKVEGGSHVISLVKRLTEIGIPVMAHIGLTPQSVNLYGGYPLQGKEEADRERLKQEAQLLQQAGAFSIVLEKIPAPLGEEISRLLSIPTIGIGAGKGCDGQILVSHDMLGLFDEFKPKFVRRYASLAEDMRKAFVRYIEDVTSGSFPSEKESF